MDFFLNIILSLLSATIFWLFFSYIPKKQRLKKIRPKVNQDLEAITTNLYQIFNTIFRSSKFVNVTYNQKVLNGTLNKEDIELGLQNKCYNLIKIGDFPLKTSMLSIGEDLEKYKHLILKKIEELYFFTEFLEENEIITLEKIKKILNLQNIDLSHKSNLSIYTMHFYELYRFYLKINKITFNKNHYYIKTNEFYDISFPLYQIDYYFYNKKDYKNCKEVSKKYIENFPSTEIFKLRLIMCEYELKKQNNGFELFKSLIKDKNYILHYSGFFSILKKYDNRILPYLEKKINDKEYFNLIKSMNEEENRIIQERVIFSKTNEQLKEYFNQLK